MRVFGKVNGDDVTFTLDGSDLWSVIVPSGSTEYYVELWAEDEAGNQSHMTTVLLAYDYEKLCFRFYIKEIGAGYSMQDIEMFFKERVCGDLR